jgi:DNA-binding MarR family transcriptional regulator
MAGRTVRARNSSTLRKPPLPDASRIERFAQDFKLSDKPGFLFRRLDTRATLLYQEFTGQTDLTPRQFGVLLTLFQQGRMTQTELSSRVHIDRSTLGEMIQRMVERGLVRRRIPDNDRRTAELWIGPAGKQALLAIVRQAEASQVALLEPLPRGYRALFLKCLSILADIGASEDGES